MPYQPDTATDIYDSLEASVSGEISALTNFGRHSPERILLDGEAEYLSRYEHGVLAAQLSGWVNFAGGPVSETQLTRLYSPEQVERIDIPFLNSLLVDYDLDQKAAENGVVRDPGSPALGTVLVTVDALDTTVPAGTIVGTTPDATGEYLAYRITEAGTPSGETTTVTVPVEAWDRETAEPAVGSQYNIGSNLIEFIPEEQPDGIDPSGVLAVTNPQATSGGEDEEGNPSLRERTKNALTRRSGGGTTGGIEGQFIQRFDAIEDDDVDVLQHYDGQPTIPETEGNPYAEVLLNAPQVTDAELADFFDRDDIFPAAVYHMPLRATRRVVDVDLTVAGTGIDTAGVENAVTRYLSALTLGEDVTDGRLTQLAMNADDGLTDADATLTVDETHTYASGTAQYTLDTVASSIESVTGTSDGSETAFVAGTDYTATDTDDDGLLDTLDFSVGGASPDAGTDFTVRVVAGDDITVVHTAVADPGAVDVTVGVGDTTTGGSGSGGEDGGGSGSGGS